MTSTYALGHHMPNSPETMTGAAQDTQRREDAAASSLSYVAADAEALRQEADLLRQHLRAVGDNNTQLQRALQQASTELRVLQASRWPPRTWWCAADVPPVACVPCVALQSTGAQLVFAETL